MAEILYPKYNFSYLFIFHSMILNNIEPHDLEVISITFESLYQVEVRIWCWYVPHPKVIFIFSKVIHACSLKIIWGYKPYNNK